MFLINYECFRKYAAFDTLYLYYRLEACRYNAVTPGIFFDMYLLMNNVLLSQSEGIMTCRGL